MTAEVSLFYPKGNIIISNLMSVLSEYVNIGLIDKLFIELLL